jgi:protein-disulfide isomerase
MREEICRMKLRLYVILSLVLICGAQSARAQNQQPAAAPDQAHLIASVESYLRNLFGWGAAFQIKLGPLKDSQLPGFYDVPIAVTYQDQTDTGTVYASKDGKFIIRGELYNMSQDPFAEIRAKLATKDSPSAGPADAKVTVVEFSDFQCPHCRVLSQNLKPLETKYPQIRIVFKNFPITAIHPWSMTAAIAARCAFQSSPEAFWKVHDAIFQQQDLISTETVYDKLTEFAAAAGLNRDDFKACLADPETQKSVEADESLGKDLKIASTPTVFVNGRENIGGDPATLEQLIDFELHRQPSQAK